MSCDTDVSFAMRAATIEDLESAIEWQKAKESAWKKFQNVRNRDETWMQENGFTSPEQFVTWGMNFSGSPQKAEGEGHYEINVEMWANENGSNVHITGHGGELMHFIRSNPRITIEGTCSNEHENECCIDAWFDEDSNDVAGCFGELHEW